MLMEDTTGKGDASRSIGGASFAIVVPLADSAAVNSLPESKRTSVSSSHLSLLPGRSAALDLFDLLRLERPNLDLFHPALGKQAAKHARKH